VVKAKVYILNYL